MSLREYIIQPGDTFFQLSKRWGGTCDDWLQANAHLNPLMLQVGQKVILPPLGKGAGQYVEVSPAQGREFSGDHLDELEMDLAGVQLKLRRIGESRVPHEIHFILPRAEIHKIQPHGENGPTELQIMLSNVNIVHSPRLTSGGGDQAETGKQTPQTPQTQPTGQQAPQPAMQFQTVGTPGFTISEAFPAGGPKQQ